MKKKSWFPLVSALCFLPLLATPCVAKTPSSPVSALFYPNEVQVVVEEKLTPESLGQGQGFLLVMPREVERSSFSALVDDSPAPGFYWLDDTAGEGVTPLPSGKVKAVASSYAAFSELESDPARQSLLREIETRQDELARLMAEKHTIASRLHVWVGDWAPEKDADWNAEQASALDESIARLVPGLYEAASRCDRRIAVTEARLAEAKANLADFDRTEVFQTVVIPYTGDNASTHDLRYTYVMPATCSVSYTIGAFPGSGELTVGQEAMVRQRSGFTWENVAIAISTTRRDKAVRPAHASGWFLSLHEQYSPPKAARPGAMYEYQAAMPSMATTAGMEEASFEPVQEEMGTFRLWNLGTRTVASDTVVNLPLVAETYKAHYYYTLRPFSNPRGFLTAELNLDKALELPQGQARFFVDNVAVGEMPLSLNGNKATLYFGNDPQVSAVVEEVPRVEGSQGVISKEIVTRWDWQFMIKNGRSRAVEVRLEDAVPQISDDAIKLVVDSQPKPEEVVTEPQQGGTRVYRWTLTLEPGESRIVTHKVQATNPADRNLSTTR